VGWVAIATSRQLYIENESVQEPVCRLDEVVRCHECSVKRIVRAKLIRNNVKVREVVLISVELLITVILDGKKQSR